MKAQKTDFEVRFQECDLMFHIISDEGRNHGNQATREDKNGSTAKIFMDFGQDIALNPEHQSDERDYFDHMIEVFFAGKGKRGGLTHAFLSESMKKT